MTRLISLAALPLYLYVGMRLAAALSSRFSISKKTARIIVFAVIAWFYIYPVTSFIYHFNGNLNRLFIFNSQSHWLDYMLLYPFWYGFIAVAEISPYFILLDISCLVSRLKIFPSRETWLRWQAIGKIAVVIFFLLYVGMRVYLDTSHVRISTSEVTIKNLPKEFNNLRLCLVGDVHVDRYTREGKLEKLKDTVQKGEEDLILFTGDLVSRGKRFLSTGLSVMCGPRQKLGAIACMGDHDYWSAIEEVPEGMRKCGWEFLDNAHRVIPYKGRRILVTGVTNVYSRRSSKFDLERLFKRAPEAELKILLVHQPRDYLVETAAEHGYHLVLAGHTHGGQIVLHPFGVPVTASQEETRFYRGRYRFKGMAVVVTNGIGLTLAPVRYHAPAEITKLTLVSGT
jgi:predicted MPP superfamily phosphohydrolase